MPPGSAGHFDRQNGDLGLCFGCVQPICKTPGLTFAAKTCFTIFLESRPDRFGGEDHPRAGQETSSIVYIMGLTVSNTLSSHQPFCPRHQELDSGENGTRLNVTRTVDTG